MSMARFGKMQRTIRRALNIDANHGYFWEEKTMRTRLAIATVIMIGMSIPIASIAGERTSINFEGFADDAVISTQYCHSHGVTFSILGNPSAFPIIALQGCPRTAYDGGNQCSQHDTPVVANGGLAALTDPLVGGTGVPNYAVGQSIGMTFNPPIDGISLYVVDIEQDDVVTLRALNGSTVVMEVTKTGADSDTGNRVSTLFTLSAPLITKVEVHVPAVIGYAIDDISFTRPTCPNGDVDGDCQLNSGDIQAFVNVLLGIDTVCTDVAAADIDHSGTVNGNDIQPFIGYLLG
jgi:hypothetical protein